MAAYGTTDRAGLLYRRTEMAEDLAENDGAAAYLIERIDGGAVEMSVDVRRLYLHMSNQRNAAVERAGICGCRGRVRCDRCRGSWPRLTGCLRHGGEEAPRQAR